MKKKFSDLCAPLALFGLTSLSGLFLLSSSATADSSTSASASITVASACSFNSTVDTEHSATISPGTYKDNIGKTTFNIACNDFEGYSLYAVGYSGNEFGNNKLLANINGTLVPSADINTGTNTSGNPSAWAMKLTPGTGLTAANILNGYSSYSAVPNQYIKIATLVPATNSTNNSSSLLATYAVNIASTQPAGTYGGKVKYTIVHPASEVPTRPYDTTAGYIGYYPNTSNVADSMGDQSISNTATSATLWVSNFKREGYGFAGWSDKYDWVVNANDANGNGTGVNAGYHIYGPNQTINFTAGQYSGTNKGLSLYAVWVKSQGTIQNWNGCGAMSVGQVTALTDTRDGNTYAVAKLADNKCWMIENLRLGSTTAMTLDSDTTNIADGTTFTLSASTDPTQTAWCESTTEGCINQSMLASNNTTNTTNNMTSATLGTSESTGIYSMGNYYNWYSATAGTGTYSLSSGNATGSICPKGWHLPTGQNASGEFGALDVAMGGTGAYQNTTEASNRFRTYPVNYIYSGYAFGSSLRSRGYYGYFWSSTARNSYYAYYLLLNSSDLGPGTDYWNRYYGLAARCVVGS